MIDLTDYSEFRALRTESLFSMISLTNSFHWLMLLKSWQNSATSMVPLLFASYISRVEENDYKGLKQNTVPTLGKLPLLNVAGSVWVNPLEKPLPVVDVLEEWAELVDVDVARPVKVEHVYTWLE